MRKYAIDTAFDHPAILLCHLRISRTGTVIQGTKAKQTIDLPITGMTGIILTVFIGKEFTAVFHSVPLSCSYTLSCARQMLLQSQEQTDNRNAKIPRFRHFH